MKPKLQDMRKRAGYRSAKAFAEHMGMSPRTYTNYEQGATKLTLEMAWVFADELSCTLDELAGRDWPPPGSTAATTIGMDESERELIGLYRSTDARGKGAIMRTAEGEAGVEGQPEAGVSERVA